MARHKKPFSEVAISRGNGDLKAIVRDNLEKIGGIGRYVKEGDTVFVKPNLTAGMPVSTGGTTDVLFTEVVVELIKEANPKHIIVGECSGNESRSIESLVNLGYADMCERQGVQMVDLDFAEFVEVPVEDPLYTDKVRLPKLFYESDVYVSVPVLKNHNGAGITVALKNSFGLVPDDDKLLAHRHSAIERILVDINSVKPPALIFADGRIGGEGMAGGSHFDCPIDANLICVGNDPVAVDAVCARLMMQNTRVRYIQWAAEKGVGNDNLDYIHIRGLSIEEAKVKFMSPAEQIMRDSKGKIRIHELGACTQCRVIAENGIGRYAGNPNSLLESVDVVLGPGEWDMPDPVNPRTVLVGDCIRPEYRDKGKWIGGCPLKAAEYMKALADYDIVCTKCMQMVKKLVAEHTEEELASIRILASNQTVFQGASNKGMMDDYMLAVGECQRNYCKNHVRRAHKLSDIDAAEYIELVEGCGPEEADVRARLESLIVRANADK